MIHFIKNYNFILFIIIITFIHQITTFTFRQLKVTPVSYVINQITTYQIQYSRSTDSFGAPTAWNTQAVPTTATVSVTFPSQYTVSSSNTCAIDIDFAGRNSVPCTLSGRTFTISNILNTPAYIQTVTVWVQNVKNPNPAIQTSQFTGTIGSDLSGSYYVDSKVQLQPAQFSSCGITFNPAIVNSTQNIIFTVTPLNQLSSTNTIIVKFPSLTYAQQLSSTNRLPLSGTLSCTNMSSNVRADIACVGDQINTNIQFTNVFVGLTTTSFSFAVRNFLSPPTTQPADSIIITSYSGTSAIDTCSTTISGLIPKTINSLILEANVGTGVQQFVVNKPYTLKFTFTLVDTIREDDYFQIDLPTGSILNFNSLTISSLLSVVQSTATYSNNRVTIKMNGSRLFVSGQVNYVTFGLYTTPPSTKTTQAFSFRIMRHFYVKQQGTATITPHKSTITVNSPSILVKTVNAITSYTFSLTTIDPLSYTGKIVITLPTQIIITFANNTNCATVNGTNMGTTPTCLINLIANTVTLINLNLSTAAIPAQNMNITIVGLQNPQSTAPTSTFNIKSYYTIQDDTLVAQGVSSIGIAANSAAIDPNFVVITPSSDIVLYSPTSYTVSFKINNPIPVGGFIILSIPKAITIGQASVSSNCKIGLNNSALSSTACSIDSSSTTIYRITYTNPFTATATAGTTIQLKLQNVCTNPKSTQSVGSFGIQTYSSNTYLISSISTGLFKNVNTPTTFKQIAISKDSQLNYDITNMTFTFNQDSPLAASSILRITLPTSVTPSASSTTQCSMLIPTSTVLTCSVSGQLIKITFPSSQVNSNINISIKITQIRNPFSFSPLGSFTLQTRTADDISKYCSQIYNPNLQNSLPSSFSSVAYSFSPRTLNSDLAVAITFTPSVSASITPPSYLQITLANSLIVGNPSTLSCSSFVDINTPVCTVLGSHTIRLSGIFTNSQMSFSLSGFKSGTTQTNDYTSLVTLDSSGSYKIDQNLNTITFSIICTLPCKTCTSGVPTQCLSCYTIAVSTNIYLDQIDKKCYDNCPDGRYQDTIVYKCYNCDLKCLTCQTTATNCQTCNTSSAYKYLNITATQNSCVSQCISGMYPQDASPPTTCMACITPCKTCTTDVICLSCVNGYFYLSLNNSCNTTCPNTQTYVQNSITNNCDPCNSSCLTCQGDVNNCTSCLGPLIYYANKCYVQCPSPLVPKNNTCGPCDSPCNTCSKTSTNCTSCLSTSSQPYLNFTGNVCVNICPIYFYQDAINGKCAQCSILGINCVDCNTATTCSNCDSGFVLYTTNYTCSNTVLPGYVNISKVAVLCVGECATCSVSTTNCTSCKTKNLYLNQCIDTCPSGFISISQICQTCLSPCRTCSSNRLNCTSCLTTLIPDVFLHNNECLELCPSTYYADQGSQSCVSCIFPCQTCTSASICQTCINGQFFYNGSCSPTCISGYVGINRVCQLCQSPCSTCQNATNKCLTCVPNTYYLESSSACVTNCGTGLYIDLLQQKCIFCTIPCKTCVNTTDTCLSCTTGILQNNVCLTQCPAKKFENNGRCVDCPASCATCTSLTVCQSCVGEYYLYLNFCIAQCPQTHAVIINGQCIQCGDQHCHKCTSADVCTQCSTDFSLLNGKCFGTCPTGYQTNGTHCLQTLNQTLTTTSDFPVPFTIATGVAIIACLMSKLQFGNTFVPGAMFSLIALCEVGALGYFLYLYFIQFYPTQPLSLYVGGGAAAFLYLLNILALFIQTCVLCYDYSFRAWYIGPNKCVVFIVTIISTIFTHKFRNILFCKLFSFSIFSAQLQDVKKFRILNIFAFLSFISSAGAIFASAVALTKATTSTQLFYECIDVIVVHGIMIVLAFFNVMKSDDFFYQKTHDGYQLNKKFQIDSQIIQNHVKPAGQDQQNQAGQFSDIKHALVSNQPFKINYQNQDQSIESLSKQYDEVSVQCLDMLNQRQPNNVRFYDQSQIQKGMPDTSKFTTIFDRTDKSIQNYIQNTQKGIQKTLEQNDHSAQKSLSLVDQSVQGNNNPNYTNKSIQGNNNPNYTNKSIQPSNKGLNDRSVQRTVFYQDQKSLQYSQKKPQVKDQSQNMSKQKSISVEHKSIQNYPMLQDQSQQAMQTITDKANQKTISVNQMSIQMGRSMKQESVQKNISNKSYQVQIGQQPNQVQYKQYTDQLGGQSIKNKNQVIFQQQSEKEEIKAKQLGVQQKDQLLLPNEQIKNYQQQLQDRIRAKQKQLSKIKYKIMLKQKDNQERRKMLEDKKPKSSQRSNKKDYVVDVGKIYKRTNVQDQNPDTSNLQQNSQSQKMPIANRPLKKQERHVGQQQNVDQQSKTLQQIQIIDDQGQKRNIPVDFKNNNNDQSRNTQEQFIDMLQGNEEIVFDEDYQEGSNQKLSNREHVLMKRQSPGLKNLQIPSNQLQSGQQSGKGQNSTNIYSSIRPMNKRNKNNDINKNFSGGSNPAIVVSQIDQSMNSDRQSINQKPLQPPLDKYRSDKQDYQKFQDSHSQANKTLGQNINKDQLNKKMRSTMQAGFNHNKKMPQDNLDQYVNKRASNKNLNQKYNPYNRSNSQQRNIQPDRSISKERNILLLAGKSQFTQQGLAKKDINKVSPLKSPMRWQYQNQDKNLSDSGQYQVPNNRTKKNKLAMPFQTDRQQTQFRHNQSKFESHHLGKSPLKRIQDQPRQPLSQYYKEKQPSRLYSQRQQLSQPNIVPVKPKISQRQQNRPYQSSELSEQPYIDDQSDYANHYKNNMLMDQLMERPNHNDDLKEYYKQTRRSKDKSKQRKRSRSKNSGLEKIYLQRMDKSRKDG